MCFRHFLAQRTQKSLTWRELAITVWPQANGSCRWITCPGERSAWQPWHSCSLCTGMVTVSPLCIRAEAKWPFLQKIYLLLVFMQRTSYKAIFFSQTIQVMLWACNNLDSKFKREFSL